jgi:hypothetical protein
LPDVIDADVVGAFLSGTSCDSLVHKLGRKGPWTTKELRNIASGQEAVGAIFDRSRGKANQDEDASEGASSCSKKKNKQWHGDSLMATAEKNGKRAPIEGTPDHFKKLLEGLCSNHAYPVMHPYKDCSQIKRFSSEGSKKGTRRSLTLRRRMPFQK